MLYELLHVCCSAAIYYKQRIAGKSLPMEKFMIRRCARYEAQGGRLLLPALELLCLWNMMPVLANDARAAQDVLKVNTTTYTLYNPHAQGHNATTQTLYNQAAQGHNTTTQTLYNPPAQGHNTTTRTLDDRRAQGHNTSTQTSFETLKK